MKEKLHIPGHGAVPMIGNTLQPDGWKTPGELIAGSNPHPETGWPGCQFYVRTNSGGPIEALAVNLWVTGRKLWDGVFSKKVRVKIEFVGDGQPSNFDAGWLHIGCFLCGKPYIVMPNHMVAHAEMFDPNISWRNLSLAEYEEYHLAYLAEKLTGVIQIMW